MVHHAPVARAEFHGCHSSGFGQPRWHHKNLVNIPAIGGNSEGCGHTHNQVGFAKLPTIGKGGNRRFCRGIAPRSTCRSPGFQRADFSFGQTAFIKEFAVPGFRFPRGHFFSPYLLGNKTRTFTGVFIADQGEGAYLTGTVAASTVLVQQCRNRAAVCWLGNRGHAKGEDG